MSGRDLFDVSGKDLTAVDVVLLVQEISFESNKLTMNVHYMFFLSAEFLVLPANSTAQLWTYGVMSVMLDIDILLEREIKSEHIGNGHTSDLDTKFLEVHATEVVYSRIRGG